MYSGVCLIIFTLHSCYKQGIGSLVKQVLFSSRHFTKCSYATIHR